MKTEDCIYQEFCFNSGFTTLFSKKDFREEEELFIYLRCFKQKKKSSVHCSSHVVSVGKVKRKGFTVKVNVSTAWGL